jgi:TP901 family phage tail tape measure protein
MSIAALGYEIDSSQAVKAGRDLDAMNQAAGRAGAGADQLERRSDALAGTMRRVAGVAGVVAGAIAAAFSARAVISGIADFDAAMSRVQAITRATSDDLQRMRDIAIDLGASTEFSAAQAADGLQFLGMAGFSAAESMAAIPQVLDLATAAGMGLAEAADTASNIMSAFGIEATNAANVTDVLAAASTRANTNVAQLGQAISTAGPIAATLGIALEDTAAAIGVMSDAGIQGERAGTALRGVMAALAGPTTQAQEALARYGLTAADVDPATRSLADIMDTLRQRGLSTADAMTIFGREAASGALVMVQGSARLREFGAELRNVNGAASEMAATMRDNLRGDLQGLSSAISSVIIALGDAGLTDALRATVQAMTTATRFIADNLVPALQGMGVIVAALASSQIPALILGLRGLVAGMTTATATAGLLTSAFTALRLITIALGGPIGVLWALIGGAAAAWIVFRDNAAEVQPTLAAVEESQNNLNIAMGNFASGAPGAGSEAIAYARNLEQTAIAALAAAEAVLAFNRARMQGVSPEALAAMQAQPGWESNPMRGILEQNAQAQAQIDASTIALDNARRTLGALTIQQHAASSASTEVAFGLGSITTAAQEVVTAINDITIPTGDAGGGGGGALDHMISRFEALRDELRTQTEQVELWYAEAQETLQWALENERITLEEHAQLRLEIERLYQEQLAAIRSQSQAQQLGDTADFFGAMAEVAQQGGERMTRVARAFGAAQALINTYLAASQTLADPSLGFFAKLAAVAKVVAAGMGLVNAIRSGGSSGRSGGGGGSALGIFGPRQAEGVTPQQPLRRTIVELRGDDWVKAIVRPVIEQIYDATRDGERIIFQ